MTIDISTLFLIGSLALLVGLIVGYYGGYQAKTEGLTVEEAIGAAPREPKQEQPLVVVNPPKDAQTLSQLGEDGKVITGEKAVVYYSVLCKTLDALTADGYGGHDPASTSDVEDATTAAEDAVRTLFGS